jgi:acyl-CoA synthetase (AMP-forming)/AMP-acid ligase II
MAVVARDRARERPDEVALRDDTRALGWAEVNDTLNRVANALHATDLGPQRRVAVYAENAVEVVLAHLGALLAGASSVPVNFHLTADEAAYILRDSNTRVLFVGPENLERGLAAAEQAGVPMVVAWRSPDAPVPWETWLAAADAGEPPEQVAPLPNLMYTSGTTGVPKGVDLPPSMFAGGSTIGEHVAALQQGRFAKLGTHLVVGPMYHTGPLSGMRTLAAGTPVVVLGRFDAERVLQAIHTHRVESSVMVPTHFKRLLELPAEVKARYDVSSLRAISHTGAACPSDVKRQMIEWFGPVLSDSYGATEVGTICSISSAEWLEHPGSVGRVVAPFVRAVVVDDDDQEVPAGVEGRLYFEDGSGRGVVYPNDQEKTARAHLRPGVFTIGEIGYVDADGYVFITDRFSDMIVAGGVNIYPAEAEAVLHEHPKVADVAVIGVPHPDLGEAVKALVVPVDPADPPTPDELIALCRASLASYKCPRTIDIVDTVGRTAMGKINKRALRAPYWEGSRTIG